MCVGLYRTALALIFLLLHRAQASCDRRSRRGSLIAAASSPSTFTFLRLRFAALSPGDCCPSCTGVSGDCWGGCPCCCCCSMASADEMEDAILRSGRPGCAICRSATTTTTATTGQGRGRGRRRRGKGPRAVICTCLTSFPLVCRLEVLLLLLQLNLLPPCLSQSPSSPVSSAQGKRRQSWAY